MSKNKPLTERPWIKFYGTDWRGDAALRSCSLAARGLWIEMLTLMHESDCYGHLLVNGKSPNEKRLAAMVGANPKEVSVLLAELEAEGVFSRTTPDGVIYSRRMVRDATKAAEDVANGRDGGNPQLTRWDKPPDPDGVKGGVNPPLNQHPNGGDKAHCQGHSHSQRPESLAGQLGDSELRARDPEPRTPLDGVVPCQKTGKPTVNGWYLDECFDRCLDAARVNPVVFRGNMQPLIAWLRDGYEPEHILAAIERRAKRPGYYAAHSLMLFDADVRAQVRRVV